MRHSKTVTVVLRPDGTVEISGEGFVGPECLEATAALEAALGVVVEEQKLRAYHEETHVRQSQRARR